MVNFIRTKPWTIYPKPGVNGAIYFAAGIFTSVSHFVQSVLRRRREGLAALRADVGLLAGVDADVFL